MYYTFQLMRKYKFEPAHDDLPQWCVVEMYEYDDPEYKQFPKGKQLSGQGLSDLTQSKAQTIAEEKDGELF